MPKFRFLDIIGLFFVVVFSISIPASTYGQEIEISTLKEQKPLTLSGSISSQQIINQTWPSNPYEKPYSGYYSGNLSVGIYGFAIPLTFTYTNKETSFTHPFNQFGLHPSYKWLKAHAGYASITLSPYTLSGRLFYGGAVEIDPGAFHAKVVYGRFQKAVEHDSTVYIGKPSYERRGYGVNIGLGGTNSHIDANLFVAGDIDTSLVNTGGIVPEQNSVMSVSFGTRLFKSVAVNGEYATTYITPDTREEEIAIEKSLANMPLWFMPQKENTIKRNALKANVSLNRPVFSIGLGYERVDPDYRTFGAYYFTNNLENMTANGSLNIFGGVISISGNAGVQREPESSSGATSNRRFVGAGNIAVRVSERLNINMSYSNFTSYTNIRSDFDYINETDIFSNYDTLNYRQISETASFNGIYSPKSPESISQTVALNLLWQGGNDLYGSGDGTVSGFYNGSISYRINIKPLGMNLNAAFNVNHNETGGMVSNTVGPTAGVTKLFFKETLKSTLTVAYNTTERAGDEKLSVMNTRFNLGYSLKQRHTFNISALMRGSNNNGDKRKRLNFTAGYVWIMGGGN
jgi:hypothetical protein